VAGYQRLVDNLDVAHLMLTTSLAADAATK